MNIANTMTIAIIVIMNTMMIVRVEYPKGVQASDDRGVARKGKFGGLGERVLQWQIKVFVNLLVVKNQQQEKWNDTGDDDGDDGDGDGHSHHGHGHGVMSRER